MRVTPLEIRQKTFEKHFRGYDKDEVNAFLLTLSQEWERVFDENKELRIKLEATEREVTKLREVETSLYKTLKTAEDTGANVIEQARHAANLHLKESQLKADAIINEAKTKARDTMEEAEVRTKQILEDMEDRLKSLTESYKKLESSREDLLSELRRIAGDLMDRVERARSIRDFNPDKYLNMAKQEAKKIIYPNGEHLGRKEKEEEKEEDTAAEPLQEQHIVVEQHTTIVESQTKKVQRSFFDELG